MSPGPPPPPSLLAYLTTFIRIPNILMFIWLVHGFGFPKKVKFPATMTFPFMELDGAAPKSEAPSATVKLGTVIDTREKIVSQREEGEGGRGGEGRGEQQEVKRRVDKNKELE
jgi:hypothetical protein